MPADNRSDGIALAVDAANEGYWDWDIINNSVYFSDGYYVMLGYEPGEFYPSYAEWRNLVHPADIERAESVVREAVQNAQSYEVEFRMRAKPGEWRWILGRGKVVEVTGDGNAMRMVGTHVDITDLKLAQEALRRSEGRFSSFMEQIPALVFMQDVDMRLCYANARFKKVFEKRGEVLGKRSAEYLPEELAGLMEQDSRRVLEGESVHRPVRVADPAVGVVHYHVLKFPMLYDAEHRLIGGVAWDVTQVSLLKELSQSLVNIAGLEDVVRSVLQSLVSSFSLEIALVYLAEAGELQFKGSACAAEDVCDPCMVDARFFDDVCLRAFHSNTVEYYSLVPYCFHTKSPGGGEGCLKSFAAVPLVLDNATIGVVGLGAMHGGELFADRLFMKSVASILSSSLTRGMLEDVIQTHVTNLEREVQNRTEELQQALHRAEDSSRVKSDFLARMSHEVRTPMNAVMGIGEELLAMAVDDRAAKLIRRMLRSMRELNSIVSGVLDVSDLEFDRLMMDDRPFLLSELFKEALAPFKERAEEKGLMLTGRADFAGADSVRGDFQRLLTVWANLIDNAVKFTSEGRVVVEASSSSDGKGCVLVCFEVHDSGVGVDPERMDSIFERFVQQDMTLRRKRGGLGLGLSIAREFAERMGGTVDLECAAGGGTVARCIVTLEESTPEEEAVTVKERFEEKSTLSVLLAEDNEDNVFVARMALQRMGHACTVASNGAEALRALMSGTFDVVLLDLEMPVMDGLEAAERIRRGEGGMKNANIPIVALTAHAVGDYRDRCRDAGIDFFLAKPFSFSDLGGLLADLGKVQRKKEGGVWASGLLDVESALQKLEGDHDLYEDLLRIFIKNTPLRMKELDVYVSERDGVQAARVVHSFKGSAATIGAGNLAVLAEKMYGIASAGDWGQFEALLPAFAQEANSIMNALKYLADS